VQHGWPFGGARQRALLGAHRAPSGVVRDDGIVAGAVDNDRMFSLLLGYLAVDGDLQAADEAADDQREEYEAAVGLAGAPLPIGNSAWIRQRQGFFLYSGN
jgi:hypothetical protein